jgi:tetratricopeptide (TPR) repeat protein
MGGLQTAGQGAEMRRDGALRYQQVWANLTARAPELQRVAKGRRQSAEQLKAELLASPPKVWLARIRGEERFRSPDLFDLLVEECHGALPFEPHRAQDFARVAVDLGRLLSAQVAQDPALEETLCRALCLGSHADRLLGEHRKADSLLVRAAFFTSDPAARGFYCRALGLLRWDQGRTEEAAALFHQASRRYRELEDTREEAICSALLGLLSSEDGEWNQAASALLKSRAGLDSQHHALLAAQAHLALARCHALMDRPAEAQALRQNVWTLYPCVPVEEAMASLLWREAQVAEALGDLDDAGTLLDSVRRRYIANGYLPEATLTTLQLSWIRARQGRTTEAFELSAKLTEAFEGKRGFDVSLRALGCLAQEMVREPLKTGSLRYPRIFQSYQTRGVFPRPVLFV